jgi:hypothetical protein
MKRHPDVTAAMVRAFGSARAEDADVVRRVGSIMNDVITRAIRPDGVPAERDLHIARVMTLVWNSSLVGWVGGVDPPERVDEDLDVAAHLLLD